MIYVLYGIDSYLRDLELKKILNSFDNNSIIKYDLNLDNLKTIIEEADTNSLFSMNKCIVVKNSYLFSAKKNDIDHDIKELETYLNSLNPTTTLVFILDTEKLDERKKVVKKIKEIGKVIEVNPLKNIKPFVKNMFGDLKINDDALTLFLDRVGSNLYYIEKEIIKLKNYTSNVTVSDVLEVNSRNSEPDIFEFIEAIVNKNIKKAYLMYEDLMVVNEEPIKIIVMLANQFRLIYQVKMMVERGFDLNHIASTLDIHPYRVKLAIESSRNYSSSVLLSFLKELANMDYLIKTGELDKKLAFEMFILKI